MYLERGGQEVLSNMVLNTSTRDQSLFVANNNENTNYKMTLTNMPRRFNFYVSDLPIGDSVIYEIEGLNVNYSAFNFGYASTGRVPQVSDLRQLENASTTSFFRNYATGNIHIKFVAQMRHGFLLPQPRMSYGDKEYGGAIVHVTYDNTLSTNQNDINSDEVSIYPNPISNTFKVNLSNNDIAVDSIQITSVLGSVVKEFDYTVNGEYNISNFK